MNSLFFKNENGHIFVFGMAYIFTPSLNASSSSTLHLLNFLLPANFGILYSFNGDTTLVLGLSKLNLLMPLASSGEPSIESSHYPKKKRKEKMLDIITENEKRKRL